jgi:hypothetical protein
MPEGLLPLRAREMRRRSDLFLGFLGAGLLLLGASFGHALLTRHAAGDGLELRARMAAGLELTDLALCTEARYTRHPSQADLHSPFQDHPTALEHFPSGSFISPRRPPAREEAP